MIESWRDRAACQGHAPLWDPALEGESYKQIQARHERAQTICAACPVRDHCLAYALKRRGTARAVEGVWGGRIMAPLSEKKHAARDARRELVHGTEAGYRRHLRHNEDPCRPCTEASRRAHADRKARRGA